MMYRPPCATDWGQIVMWSGLVGMIGLVVGKVLADLEHRRPPE